LRLEKSSPSSWGSTGGKKEDTKGGDYHSVVLCTSQGPESREPAKNSNDLENKGKIDFSPKNKRKGGVIEKKLNENVFFPLGVKMSINSCELKRAQRRKMSASNGKRRQKIITLNRIEGRPWAMNRGVENRNLPQKSRHLQRKGGGEELILTQTEKEPHRKPKEKKRPY